MPNSTVPAAAEGLPDDMTDEDFAAMDFEPWQHEPDEWKPPSNEEWARLANPYLVSVRMAWLTLFKTKPELMEMIAGMDREGIFELYGNGIRDSIDFFKAFLAVLEAAEARIICAGLSLGDEEDSTKNRG
ncbi:hypothetical protein [Stappia sp. ES.058]|uniref:hypothetical protein n=1 Tax=Stappia sp. ES.058 TaxID=1881061 RepID=UPI00087C43EE|nr:hypothetical protein [Stappia sp. ES.058]SDU42320.1 hypothetical protein SAMN05428979_3684 [Stappia sp. ES.058]